MPEVASMNEFRGNNGALPGSGHNLRRTVFTLVNISMRRYLFTRYMWVLLFLGGIPIAISIIYMIAKILTQNQMPVVSYSHLSDLNKIIQTIFRVLYMLIHAL